MKQDLNLHEKKMFESKKDAETWKGWREATEREWGRKRSILFYGNMSNLCSMAAGAGAKSSELG